MTFFRVASTSYSASNPFLTSTPSFFLGRSRTCPMDAFTWKSRPRYLLIVFALAGDSTMTRFLATLILTPLGPAYEERARQALHLPLQLQLPQPLQQLRHRHAAALLQLVQAQRRVRAQRVQERLAGRDGR